MQTQPTNPRQLIAAEEARVARLEREIQSERDRQAGLRTRIDELTAQIQSAAEERDRAYASSSNALAVHAMRAAGHIETEARPGESASDAIVRIARETTDREMPL